MSGYEVEHNIKEEKKKNEAPPRRPDLSTFFTTLDLVDTSGDRHPQNAHSLPLPGDVSAAFRNLANAFSMMQGGGHGESQDGTDQLLGRMIEQLMQESENPPREVKGVSDDFLAQLDRVPKTSLKDKDCPICGNPFLDDSHPLVVQLPCHKDHLFDLECITPWLKLNPTCPLDRKELVKKRAPTPPPDEEDGEYDDMYA
ncbi:hypothetical protein D6D13_02809 [Aureobasidium pullulans]|uniref:RING-type domain-containing protein n=1 Tax=Aureobasidium pullulans TaxID=5580 RepID=A0A4T0ANX1_AURPU|nr:hypothetical protein D6D13_02809 [Aureobasidium pullulans]TIA22153.1 hypothetical protein D6C81_03430 [Aureobasidium pullulans]